MSMGTGRCCVKCQTYLFAKKNEVVVLETFEDGITPYKIWLADLFQCPDCEYENSYFVHPVAKAEVIRTCYGCGAVLEFTCEEVKDELQT